MAVYKYLNTLTIYRGKYYSGFNFHNQGRKKTDIKSIDMQTGCAQAHHNVSEFGILCLFFKFVLLKWSLFFNLKEFTEVSNF
jgi:hypothetical protein